MANDAAAAELATPSYWRFVIVGGILAAAAAAALSIDVPLASWFRDHDLGSLDKLVGLSEVFGHGLGVAMILLAVHQFDRRRRWSLPRVVAGVLAAGLSADVVKVLVARTPRGSSCRPSRSPTACGRPSSAGCRGPAPVSRARVSLRDMWRPLSDWPLGWGGFTPRDGDLLAALVVLVACQRMAAGAHFASDALSGAAVGCLGAGVLYCCGPVARFFDRLQKKSLLTRFWESPILAASREQNPVRQFGGSENRL